MKPRLSRKEGQETQHQDPDQPRNEKNRSSKDAGEYSIPTPRAASDRTEEHRGTGDDRICDEPDCKKQTNDPVSERPRPMPDDDLGAT